MKKSILVFEKVTIAVESKPVLQNISLRIFENEVVALTGPNGSGKSSLLGTIMGLNRYQVIAGKIFFKNIDITKLTVFQRSKLGIGLMFQQPPSFKDVSLFNLWDKLNINPADQQQIVNLDVKHLLDRPLNNRFSGGEIKRSELAQLLIQKPDFVCLDEPDSGVDSNNLKTVIKTCQKLVKEKSGLIVSHNQSFLEHLPIDRTITLKAGAIVNDSF